MRKVLCVKKLSIFLKISVVHFMSLLCLNPGEPEIFDASIGTQ